MYSGVQDNEANTMCSKFCGHNKLYLTKLFLNILILGNETMEYGKLFQIATACEKINIKRVCVSLRLKECERMSVSCEVISAGFVQ